MLSCDGINMWDRILVGSNATIEVDMSTISDAKVGVALAGAISPIIKISNTQFNRNLTSISIGSSINGSYSYFKNIEISCESSIGSRIPANLLNPYSSQRSATGITLISLPYFSFSSSTPDFTFKMFNIETGVNSFSSSFVFENAFFANCGKGILLKSTKASFDTKINNVKFKDCIDGITRGTLFKRVLLIHDCQFTDFTKSAISLYDTYGSNILIFNNLINYDFSSGVPIPDPYHVSTAGNNGIYIHNAFTGLQQKLEIHHNYITNSSNAIALQNVTWEPYYHSAIFGNFIKLQTPYSSQLNPPITTAIRIENCINVTCYQNDISRELTPQITDGLEQNQITGVYFKLSSVPYIFSPDLKRMFNFENRLENVSNSFMLEGSCLGHEFACNKIIDAYYGVSLGGFTSPGAHISDQIAVSTNYDPYNLWYDQNCNQRDWRVYGLSAAPCIWNNIGSSSNPLNEVYPNTAHCIGVNLNYLNPANAPYYCDIQPSVPDFEIVSARETLLGSIVRNEIEFSENEYMYRKWSGEFAFRTLTQVPELLEIAGQGSENDSYLNFYNDMLISNSNLFNQVQKFILDEDFYNATTLLSSIVPNDSGESFMKFCYSAYLTYDANGNQNYDETTIDRLNEIAFSSFYLFGEAVFMARGMLHMIIDETNNFKKRPFSFNTQNNVDNLSITNPISNYLNLKSINNLNGNLKICSLEGKTVLQTNLNSSIQDINVSGIANGLYFLVITSETGSYFTEKIIIQK